MILTLSKVGSGMTPTLADAIGDALAPSLSEALHRICDETSSAVRLSDAALASIREELHTRAARFLLPSFTVHLAAARAELFARLQELRRLAPSVAAQAVGDAISPVGAAFVDELVEATLRCGTQALIDTILTAHTKPQDPLPEIAAIEFAKADQHNGGHKVVLLTQRDGRRVAYKGVNPFPVVFFGDAVRWVADKLSVEVPAIEVLDKGPSHYHARVLEFTTTGLDESQAAAFYEWAGVLLAIAYAIRATDLHSENVGICNRLPIVFDVETIGHSAHGLTFTTATTGLLDRMGLSGLLGGGNVVETGIFLRESSDENALAISYLEGTWRAANRPRSLTSTFLLEPRHYTADILSGFRRGYEALREGRGYLLQCLHRRLESEHCRSRVVVRPTAFYTVLLSHLAQPSGAARAERLKEIRQRLCNAPNLIGASIPSVIVDCEIFDLLNGDIPYFWTYPHEPMIHHGNGASAPILAAAVQETLTKALESLSVQDQEEQVQIILAELT